MNKTLLILGAATLLISARAGWAGTNYVCSASDGTVLYVTEREPIYDPHAGTVTFLATKVRLPDRATLDYRIQIADITLGGIDWTKIALLSTTNTLPEAFTNVTQVQSVPVNLTNTNVQAAGGTGDEARLKAAASLLLEQVNALRAQLGLPPETMDEVNAATGK